MSCGPITSGGKVIGTICRPSVEWLLSDRRCPICGYDVGLMGMYQEWYGTAWTCLACGDSWMDDELAERPWRRGWRRDRVLSALKHLPEARVLMSHSQGLTGA